MNGMVDTCIHVPDRCPGHSALQLTVSCPVSTGSSESFNTKRFITYITYW